MGLEARRKKRAAMKKGGDDSTMSDEDKEDLAYEALSVNVNKATSDRDDLRESLEARKKRLQNSPQDAVDLDEQQNLELQIDSLHFDEKHSDQQAKLRARLAARRNKLQTKKHETADDKGTAIGEELAELDKHLDELQNDTINVDDIKSMEDSVKEERKSRGNALKARLAARRKAALAKKDKKAAQQAAKELAQAQKEQEQLAIEEAKIAEETCSKETQKILELQKQKEILEDTLDNTEIADKLSEKLVDERNKQSTRLKERLAKKRKRM